MIDKIDVTVAAVIKNDQRYLMIEEFAGGRLVFNQPAGHLEPGESLIEAAIRETQEESGYAFQPEALLGLYLWHCDEARTTFLRIAFCGQATAPAARPTLDEGIVATHWLTRAQLLAREAQLRSPLVLRCIDDFETGTFYPLTVVAELPVETLVRLAAT